ncbi:MAG: glycosyl transferase, partial [Oscillochloris sp.]|nr:glycosyl transferase [Oscillochloris sp.]
LLALQFAIAQLLTGVQFGDAPRNMHWGVLTFEQPSFLSGAVDTSERIKGFRPDPESLGPLRLWDNTYGSLHPWWGPVAPLLFAVVWGATRSYTLLQLVVPLAGGATVLLTYALARDNLGERRALLAAAFLACFPLFREYSSVSYTETLSALWLTVAFLCYLRGWTLPTVFFGTLAALSKMDMLAMYSGVILACAAWDLLRGERRLPLRHHTLALLVPLLLASPWIWIHTLNSGQHGPTQGLSIAIFRILLPQLTEMLFYAPWYISLLTLGVIFAAAVLGLRARVLPSLSALLLWVWIGLGLLVTLVYAATPGAGNSPRVIIPALPALAVLFAAGMPLFAPRPRRLIAVYLIALFVAVNLVVINYETSRYGAQIRAAAPAFAALRQADEGFVLTPLYWETILYTRRHATWFEADPTFRDNMMHDEANFARYVKAHPIRYVLLPDSGPDAASPEVVAYLSSHAQLIDSGELTLYVLSQR